MSKHLFRKVLALILCLGIIVSVIPGGRVSALEYPVTLTNPGFEEPVNADGTIPGWERLYGDETNFSVSGEDKHTGNYSLKVVDNDTEASKWFYSNKVDVTAGNTVNVSAWAKVANGDVQLCIQYFNDSGDVVGVYASKTVAATEWSLQNVQGTVPEGATKACIFVYSGMGGVCTAYFDDFTLAVVDPKVFFDYDCSSMKQLADDGWFTETPRQGIYTVDSTASLGNPENVELKPVEAGQFLLYHDDTAAADDVITAFKLVDSINKIGSKPWLLDLDLKFADIMKTDAGNVLSGFSIMVNTGEKIYRVNFGQDNMIRIETRWADPYPACEEKSVDLHIGDGQFHRWSLYGDGAGGVSIACDGQKVAEFNNIAFLNSWEPGVQFISYRDGAVVSGNNEIYFDNIKLTLDRTPDWAEQPADRPELVNGGFEDVSNGKPTGWSIHPYSDIDAFEASTEQVHSGTYSIKITDNSNILLNCVTSTPITVIPGEKYEASAYCYNLGGPSTLILEFLDAGNQRISAAAVNIDTVNEWTRAVVNGMAPEGAVYAAILLNINTASSGITYFDDAAFEHKTLGLKNEGFEAVVNGKPSDWTINSGSVESSQEIRHSGEYSVKLTDSSSESDCNIRSSQIFAQAGKEYEASVYTYNTSGISEIYLEFWDANNQRISVAISKNESLDSWKEISAKGTAPSNTAYATILINLNKANIGACYADDVSFRYVEPAPETPRKFPLAVEGHPRLFFTNQDIPAMRAKAADTNPTAFGTTGSAIWKQVEDTARAYLTEESFSISYYGGYTITYQLPPKQPGKLPLPPGYTGDSQYPYWTMMARNIQQRMETLSLAYVITGEQAFAERAKEYALSVAGWSTWSDPYYSDGGITCLDTAHLTFGVCAVYDMLYNILTEDERAILEDAIDKRGLEPLYQDCRANIDHNIQVLREAALGVGALTVLGKNPDANIYLTHAVSYYSLGQFQALERFQSR